jgi:hypothetical protein
LAPGPLWAIGKKQKSAARARNLTTNSQCSVCSLHASRSRYTITLFGHIKATIKQTLLKNFSCISFIC